MWNASLRGYLQIEKMVNKASNLLLESQMQRKAIAQSIANRLLKKTEGDGPLKFIEVAIILQIIEILLPIIIDCFAPDDGEQVKQYLNARWDSSKSSDKYGGYRRGLVRTLARRAKFGAFQLGQRLTWAQSMEIAIATLDELRDSDNQVLSIAINE